MVAAALESDLLANAKTALAAVQGPSSLIAFMSGPAKRSPVKLPSSSIATIVLSKPGIPQVLQPVKRASAASWRSR